MRNIHYKKGFTLVEMIVAIAIFTIVALVAVGALLKIVDANKRSQSFKTSINNINFSLESMIRELRVGGSFVFASGSGAQSVPYVALPAVLTKSTCTPTCMPTGASWVIAFHSSRTALDGTGKVCNLIHEYRYNPDLSVTTGRLEKAEQQSCSDVSSPVFIPIISPDIVFTTSVMNADIGPTIQSLVFFHFVGYSGAKERERTYFDLQTSVSQRISD